MEVGLYSKTCSDSPLPPGGKHKEAFIIFTGRLFPGKQYLPSVKTSFTVVFWRPYVFHKYPNTIHRTSDENIQIATKMLEK